MKSKLNFNKSDHREQYEYARSRIRKKRRLVRHFIFFIAGSILFLIMDLILKLVADSLPTNWSAYLILFWFFLLLVHTLNFLLINKFMDKEWENRQIEKLKNKQMERILQLQKKVEKKYILTEEKEEAKEIGEIIKEKPDESDHSRFQP